NDVATLGGENVLDVHGSPPSACSARAECRLDNARFAIEFRQPRHPATDGPPDLCEERSAPRRSTSTAAPHRLSQDYRTESPALQGARQPSSVKRVFRQDDS